MNTNILVVEDDEHLLEYVKGFLHDRGYLVRTTGDGIQALEMIKKTEPDLVILDLELPKLKGDAVCLELKKYYPHIPIIILTARDSTSQIVQGLQLGADDYMTKPFEGEELAARIQARLRYSNSVESILQVGDLTLNTDTLDVKRGSSHSIQLTPQEFKLLEYLMKNKGRVLTREMILSRLWQGNPDIETRVVDVYVGYLRKKIDTGKQKKLIQSLRGFGYKIDAT